MDPVFPHRLTNSLRLTYDSTLAELTSLEEMMKTMMDEELVHHDIINKLWQVYSKLNLGIATSKVANHFC